MMKNNTYAEFMYEKTPNESYAFPAVPNRLLGRYMNEIAIRYSIRKHGTGKPMKQTAIMKHNGTTADTCQYCVKGSMIYKGWQNYCGSSPLPRANKICKTVFVLVRADFSSRKDTPKRL